MQASKPQPSQNQPTPSPPDSRPETMTSGALGSPTAGILNTKKNPSCVPPPPVNSPVTSLRTASCGRRCVERLWPVTRLGVRLVTHWETAWLWLAAIYTSGSGWGLMGIWVRIRRSGSSGEGEENNTNHPVVHLLTYLQLSRFAFQSVS